MLDQTLEAMAGKPHERLEFWTDLLNEVNAENVAEVGVFKGDFAEAVLRQCAGVKSYAMIDPWRNLPDWNKPANLSQINFDEVYDTAMNKTSFAKDKITVHRDTTKSCSAKIKDRSLDFVYIDGDHTLRGITIDLLLMYQKVKNGGLIGGDDFTRSIWQHEGKFDPTFVCPFAIYFAEAMNVPVYSLPNSQFLIVKDEKSGFKFTDLDGRYANLSINDMIKKPNMIVAAARKFLPAPVKAQLRRLVR
ncbi:MAG: class I SAM-dependent methyltransferase [Hyphomicrobiales bacterium]|nr:class I SAM-dependent methyltransferase [Hyphomicrobiales bacterium]